MHQYADYSQVYAYMTVNNAASAVDRFATCLTDVEAWLRACRLRLTLNPTKIQLMWLGSSQHVLKLDITHVHVISLCLRVQDTARDLGVVIDRQLSTVGSRRCSLSTRSGYYQLHQLRQAVWFLSEDANKTLVQVFISCHLNYCNSLFFGILGGLMNQLQSVLNTTACLVTGSQCSDHIMPVLHWLPIRQCVDFKVAMLLHQSLSGI